MSGWQKALFFYAKLSVAKESKGKGSLQSSICEMVCFPQKTWAYDHEVKSS